MKIDVSILTDVSPDTIETAKNSVNLVLSNELPGYNEVSIIFCAYITDEDGEKMTHAAETFRDKKTIVFAMKSDSMQHWIDLLGQDGAIRFIAAHEAAHIWQSRRRQNLVSCANMPEQQRGTLPQELEANEIACHVWKFFRPSATGSITIDSWTYDLPTQSKYTK